MARVRSTARVEREGGEAEGPKNTFPELVVEKRYSFRARSGPTVQVHYFGLYGPPRSGCEQLFA